MRVFIDLNSRAFVASSVLPQRVTQVLFTHRDVLPVEVQFVRDNVVVELPDGSTGKCAIGQAYGGDLLAFDTGWDKTGEDTETVYTFSLNLNTTELAALFEADEEAEADEVTAKFEIEWTVGGNVSSTLPCMATIYNDIIRDDAAVPTSIAAASFLLQAPDDSIWAISIDSAGALTATKQD